MVRLYNKVLCSHGKQYVEGCLVTPNNGHHKQISEKSQKEVKRVFKKSVCIHT